MEPTNIYFDNERTCQALTIKVVSDRHANNVHLWVEYFIGSNGASDVCEWGGPGPGPSCGRFVVLSRSLQETL